MQEVTVGLVSPTVTEPPKATADPLIVILELANLAFAIEPANLSLAIEPASLAFVTAPSAILAMFKVPESMLAALIEATSNVPYATTSITSPVVKAEPNTTEVPEVM